MNGDSGAVYSLLVPLASNRLLIPRACVLEVIGYHVPMQMSGAPPWYLGAINWNGQHYPLVSFEGVCAQNIPPFTARCRIVLVHALGGRLASGAFGIAAQAHPQLLRVSMDVIQADMGYALNERLPILCRAKLVSDTPLVPDLERLEAMIADETSAITAR